jgi:hypothetical protein
MAAGDLLAKAKPQVGHGQWEGWVERNCKFSVRTARLYMRLADNRATIEAQMSLQPGLGVKECAKLLAKPSRSQIGNRCRFDPGSSAWPQQANPRGPGKNVAHGDLWLLWDRLPAAEREAFFDQIGLRSILDSIPETWRRDVEVRLSNWDYYPPSVWRKTDPNAVEPAAGDGDGDDLTIPTFLRREPEAVR